MRVPPSLANSAMTPAFRRFTSSMNFGGNDHSRPTRSPTFFMTTSIVSADVEREHLVPKRPVVGPAVPQTQGVPDSLLPQRRGKPLVGFTQAVVAAHRQNNVLLPQ